MKPPVQVCAPPPWERPGWRDRMGDPKAAANKRWQTAEAALRSQPKPEGTGSALIPQRLIWARAQRHLTTRGLAHLAGCSSPAVSSIERGESVPGTALVERLAKVLEVSAAWLAYGE